MYSIPARYCIHSARFWGSEVDESEFSRSLGFISKVGEGARDATNCILPYAYIPTGTVRYSQLAGKYGRTRSSLAPSASASRLVAATYVETKPY